MFYAKAMRIYTSNTIHCTYFPPKIKFALKFTKKNLSSKKNNKTCIGTGIEALANSEVRKKQKKQ